MSIIIYSKEYHSHTGDLQERKKYFILQKRNGGDVGYRRQLNEDQAYTVTTESRVGERGC